MYDITEEKKNFGLELPEYVAASPRKKSKNDEYEIPDLDTNEEEEEVFDEKDVDLDDPDWDYVEEEEENDDEEFEKTKSKQRCYSHYPRTTAAAIRFGISTFALTVLIWAYNMGKKII